MPKSSASSPKLRPEGSGLVDTLTAAISSGPLLTRNGLEEPVSMLAISFRSKRGSGAFTGNVDLGETKVGLAKEEGLIEKGEADDAGAIISRGGEDFGSGYPHDPLTRAFLEKDWQKHNKIFRKSWASYQNQVNKLKQGRLDQF